MPFIEKRVHKDGHITYRANVRLKGYPKQEATFRRLSDAKRWGAKVEAQIRDGQYFPENLSKKRTLNELIERYERDVIPTKRASTGHSQQKHLDWWKERIGIYTMDRITPALLSEIRDELLSGMTPRGKTRTGGTVTRYMASLSHVFTVAIKEWQWMETNPFLRVTKPKQSRGIVRFLSDDERARLLQACRESTSDGLYLAVVAALSTGCRRGELWNIKWSHVDLKRGLLIFEDTKNGERRNVPLMGHALELMKERHREQKKKLEDKVTGIKEKPKSLEGEYVFPGKIPGQPMDFTHPWRNAMQTAEIEDFRWHDLRHSCASYLAMNGATLAEIAEVLGHKTLQMVKRYAHLSDAHTSKVVASMNEKIFS
jgi:integrase